MKYWTLNNKKILKGRGKGYLTAILHLSPADLAFKYAAENNISIDQSNLKLVTQGKPTLCAGATKECQSACLNTAGNGNFPSVQLGRINKTLRLLENPVAFIDGLKTECNKIITKADKLGLVPVFRPNGTQDIPLEKIRGSNGLNLFEEFQDCQFYDYTKLRNRRDIPPNYHLTYSYTGYRGSENYSVELLHSGRNIAFVYSGEIPKTWFGFPVVNGDNDDLRFLDPQGVAVALKAKGKARGKSMRFVRDYSMQLTPH